MQAVLPGEWRRHYVHGGSMAKQVQAVSDGRDKVLAWLRAACARYQLEPIAVYRAGRTPTFPMTAKSEAELQAKLKSGGHFLPLPKEPAALANVLEVSLIEFLLQELTAVKNASAQRGTERGYPDIEIDGPSFGNAPHAIEIKAARRGLRSERTAAPARTPKAGSRSTPATPISGIHN